MSKTLLKAKTLDAKQTPEPKEQGITTESPSIIVEAGEGEEGHEEEQQGAGKEEQQDKQEKTATPKQKHVRNSAAYEDWYSLSKHFVFAVMTVTGVPKF